jgi:crotonobetainyl-CoA:carnitine CoA-transferase CaiB-like acyl-CoA transferase
MSLQRASVLVVHDNFVILAPIHDPSIGATHTVNSPVQVAGARKVTPSRAPRLGEHSENVLGDLGYDAAQVAQLAADGVVRGESA